MDGLELHVRTALGDGVTPHELRKVLLQCGVPAANSAFAIAERVLEES